MSDNKAILLVLGGAIAFVAIIVGISFWWNGFTCGTRWQSFETKWGIIEQCMVKVDGKWIPEKNVRAF